VLPGGSVSVNPDMPLETFEAEVIATARDRSLEELREQTAAQNSALAGLALILALYSRLPNPDDVPTGWRAIASQRSDHQPGLLGFGVHLRNWTANKPSVSDTIAWMSRQFILVPHETIAYSKLPNFTFRFRWEQGRLRFYDLDTSRFGLTDIRRDAFSRLLEDVGMWSDESGVPILTEVGRTFVHRVFS
jgi:hypothetical protein